MKEETKKKVLLIYHKDDNDGVFSAALITWYLVHNVKDIKFEDIYRYPADYVILSEAWKYDEVKKWHDEYENVIMTDVSFNDWKAMKYLSDEFGNNFTWIDHHAPIIKESIQKKFDKVNGNRDTHKSAILLAYEHYIDPLNVKFNQGTHPQVLGALSAYDCWNWDGLGYDGEECKTINVAVNVLVKLDFIKALGLIEECVNLDGTGSDKDRNWYSELLIKGHEYRAYQKYEWDNLMKIADKEWKVVDNKNEIERTAAAIFYNGPTNSMMFDSIKDEVQCGIVFKVDTVTNIVTISLYNTKDEYSNEFDCGKFCKDMYYGGGHKGAAGFNISLQKLNKIIKSKTI